MVIVNVKICNFMFMNKFVSVENLEDFESFLFEESKPQKPSGVPQRQKRSRTKLKTNVPRKPVAIVQPDSHEAHVVPATSNGAVGWTTQW